MEIKGPSFGSHDITMFSRQEQSAMTESRQWNSSTKRNINYSSFNQQSLVSDMIGGGKALTGSRRGVDHPSTSPGGRQESLVEAVQKEKRQVETPEWMEERSSPETKRRSPDVLDISMLLSYPSRYSPKRNAPDPRKVQHESTIRPEFAKRDQSVPVLRPEDFEHPKSTPKRGRESVVEAVQKERREFEAPDWMEERPSPETKRRQSPDILDINMLLRYPSGHSPKRNSPDPRKVQYESTIRPEFAKRDQSVPMLRPEDFEDDDEDDEFEEVIIVVDVQRSPLWRKGLEKPKPQPQKVGKPIQNLLELPTRRPKRESPPDKLSVLEKIESLQRPQVVYEGRDLASILKEL